MFDVLLVVVCVLGLVLSIAVKFVKRPAGEPSDKDVGPIKHGVVVSITNHRRSTRRSHGTGRS